MNLYLLISLIVGNLFLCGLILFNWYRENHYQVQLPSQETEQFHKIQPIEIKLKKPKNINNSSTISFQETSKLIDKSEKEDKNQVQVRTIISKAKPELKSENIKRLEDIKKVDIVENKDKADLKGQINQITNIIAEKPSVTEKPVYPNQNAESKEAIDDLTNQYYVSLNLSKKETKALLNTLLKPNSKNPCLAWQIKGHTLERCRAKSILEAGIYAINAKLIPCKEQIRVQDYKTYIACYKERKKPI